jgi:DNA-binding transcriptional LysR family regulator
MNITLRQLQAFIVIAETGNFTRASEQLRIAQSAMSDLVKGLEAELRVRLFNRTTRRVELTDAGNEFRSQAQRILADLNHAVQNAHDLVDRKRGRITVATTPTLAVLFVPQAMALFSREFPGVKVVLVDTQSTLIVEKVQSGEFDIGVGSFPNLSDSFTRTYLGRDTLAVFVERNHPIASMRRLKWTDLKGLPLITLSRASGIRSHVEFQYRAADLPFQPAYEVIQMTTAMALAEAGLGIAVLPLSMSAYRNFRRLVFREMPQLAFRPTSKLGAVYVYGDISAITNSQRALPPAAKDFLTSLKASATLFRK